MKMPVSIKWFPPSWFQIKTRDKIIYIDPAYLKKYYTKYPHKDHCKGATVNRLRHTDTLVVAPKRCIKELGKDIEVIKPGEEKTSGDIKIKAVEAYNTEQGNSTKKVHHKGDCVGYLTTLNGKTIYHAGDTDFIPEMKELRDIEVALLPIGGTFTMDIQEAVEAAIAIKPKIVIPMHHLKVYHLKT
jgi:L-ascorbate metabolism protein UlaG (beta-lactamase superfamily)